MPEKPFEVCGVLAGGIDPDVQPCLRVAAMQQVKLLLQLAIPFARLNDGHWLCGRLAVWAEKADMVSIARGINTDAEHQLVGSSRKDHVHTLNRMGKRVRLGAAVSVLVNRFDLGLSL